MARGEKLNVTKSNSIRIHRNSFHVFTNRNTINSNKMHFSDGNFADAIFILFVKNLNDTELDSVDERRHFSLGT